MHRNKHRESAKIRRQTNLFQTKRKDKTLEKELKEMETHNLPEAEFKILVIRMLKNLGENR